MLKVLRNWIEASAGCITGLILAMFCSGGPKPHMVYHMHAQIRKRPGGLTSLFPSLQPCPSTEGDITVPRRCFVWEQRSVLTICFVMLCLSIFFNHAWNFTSRPILSLLQSRLNSWQVHQLTSFAFSACGSRLARKSAAKLVPL